MVISDVFNYYSNEFLPVYARAVAELQDKPVQITVEIENAFSHLSVASIHERDGNIQKQIEHLKKSLGHIERATLDAYKFIWISLLKKLILIQPFSCMKISKRKQRKQESKSCQI